MRLTQIAIAILGVHLTITNAHILMDQPGVYYDDGADVLRPLSASGVDFPCTVSSFKVYGTLPTLTPGGEGQIHLFGSAVHAGGSCQVSITYDQPPTRYSVWKAIKSWETGCPRLADGNLEGLPLDPKLTPQPLLSYNLPMGLHSGKATIAWTWFNREGNREMYMRCHAATIGGSNTVTATFDKMQHMFVANIAPAECEVPRMVDLKFPNPALETQGSGSGAPIGSGCGKPIEARGHLIQGEMDDLPHTVLENNLCVEGETKCSGNNWAMCEYGAWVSMGALAAGTDCSAVTGGFSGSSG